VEAKVLYIFLPHPEPEVGTVTPAKKKIYYSLHMYTYITYACIYIYIHTYIHTCLEKETFQWECQQLKKKLGNACG
jgi:hypothetical protein